MFQSAAVRCACPIAGVVSFALLLCITVELWLYANPDWGIFCYPFYSCDVRTYGYFGIGGQTVTYWTFAVCFIVPAFFLGTSAYLINCNVLFKHPDNKLVSCGAWTTLVTLMLSWIALLAMALSDGFYHQHVHFPAALVGMGLLAMYEVGHAGLYIYTLGSSWSKGQTRYLYIRAGAAVVYLCTPILSVVMVIMWIHHGNHMVAYTNGSGYEWIAVCSLVAHFLPMSVELGLDDTQPLDAYEAPLNFRVDPGRQLVLPNRLASDAMWTTSARPHLQFVVHNATVAGLANLEAAVANPIYESAVREIRLGLKSVFQRAFQWKAGFCNPVEWRPREFNSPPDTICHWVLDAGTDVSDLPRGAVLESIRKGQPLQIHCDGGFVDNVGAASFVVHTYDLTGQIVRLGFMGQYLARARSDFHVEVTALANAINWVSEICGHM